MEVILPFLQQNEFIIYTVLGIVALINFQKLVSAWSDWQGTLFGIERDLALRRFKTTLTLFLLLVLFALAEVIIVSFVVPTYPKTAAIATPTIDLLATPTVTLSARVDGISASATETTTPEAEPQQEGCSSGQIEWVFPVAGDEVSQTVRLVGTVNVPNLGYYKYDFSTLDGESWMPLAVGKEPKVNGEIGFWDTSVVQPGDYLLRLSVRDNEDNLLPVCTIQVRVVETQ